MACNYEKADHIVTITLNRPKVLNAFTRDMHRELNESFVRFREDEDARVAVVTGAGERAFSSGQDLKELETILAEPEPLPDLWESYFGNDLASGLDVWKPGLRQYVAIASGRASVSRWRAIFGSRASLRRSAFRRSS